MGCFAMEEQREQVEQLVSKLKRRQAANRQHHGLTILITGANR